MTKKEYIKTKAELEALHSVLYNLKRMSEEKKELAEEAVSEYSKHLLQTKGDILEAAFHNCQNTFRRSRTDMLRAIAEYEIEHPLDIF